MKRILIIVALIFAAFISLAQTPYNIRNKYVDQIWRGDTARLYVYNADTSDIDSLVYWGDCPAWFMWDSIFIPEFVPGLGDTNILFVNGTTGKLSATTAAAIGGSASSKWKITGVNLHPLDTGLNVVVGSDDAKGNLFRVDEGRVLFGTDTAGFGAKFMWIPEKWALRAGYAAGPYWDYDSTGNYSVSFGYWNRSTGAGSFTTGYFNTASGIASFGANVNNTVVSNYASVFGRYNYNNGIHAFVGGLYDTTYGNVSFLHGQNLLTSSNYHNIFGAYNDTAGYSTWTNCGFIPTEPLFTVANGNYTTRRNCFNILKNGTISFQNYTFPLADGNALDVLQTDGAGTVSWQPMAAGGASYWDSTAGVIHLTDTTNDVAIGVKTMAGTEDFRVYNGAVLFDGTTGGTPVSGVGTRMMWIPEKATFRAGIVPPAHPAQWDAANINTCSFTFGEGIYNTGTHNMVAGQSMTIYGGMGHCAFGIGHIIMSSGNYNFLMGASHYCYGASYSVFGGYYHSPTYALYSAFFGRDITSDPAPSGTSYSLAVGYLNKIHGIGSFVGGYLSANNADSLGFTYGKRDTTTARFGFTTGQYNYNQSYNAAVFGRYNVKAGTTTSWVSTESLFVVGNGHGNTNRNNAFSILKNGTTYIGDKSDTTDAIMVVNPLDSTVKVNGWHLVNKKDHAFYAFEDSAVVVDCTQDVWVQVTNADKSLFAALTQWGFSVSDDTITFTPHDTMAGSSPDLIFHWGIDGFGGNGEDYEVRIYNVTRAGGVMRKAEGTTTGANNRIEIGTSSYDNQSKVNHRYVMQIMNKTNSNDFTIENGSIYIEVSHY